MRTSATAKSFLKMIIATGIFLLALFGLASWKRMRSWVKRSHKHKTPHTQGEEGQDKDRRLSDDV
ncbi:hypothetical protein ELI60_30405, partial [Klebsiella pneumoniae]|nr:hypothetical protein [Klebsiella pneumoniae]